MWAPTTRGRFVFSLVLWWHVSCIYHVVQHYKTSRIDIASRIIIKRPCFLNMEPSWSSHENDNSQTPTMEGSSIKIWYTTIAVLCCWCPTYRFKQKIRTSWSPCVHLKCCFLYFFLSFLSCLSCPPCIGLSLFLREFKPASSSLLVLWMLDFYWLDYSPDHDFVCLFGQITGKNLIKV